MCSVRIRPLNSSMGACSTLWSSFDARQADVCHAYQILKRGGVKEENIVVFMYDDIAKNSLNPRPGVIINHPKGKDVYAGVPKVLLRTWLCSLYFSIILNKGAHVILISHLKIIDYAF